MKRLFLQVYSIIMGSLLIAMVATEHFNNWFYTHEVEAEYLNNAIMLTQAIRRDIAIGDSEAGSLDWWRRQLHDYDEIELEVTPLEPGMTHAYVKKITITEAEDQLEVITPFDATRALIFSVRDRAEPGALWAYYSGYVFLYLLLAVLLYVLTHRLYRYINEVRRHAQRVADGDYSASQSKPRFAAFVELHDDLNRMTQKLAEKTQENHLLTASIHHELRTPLTRLRLALDMALTTPREQEIPELLQDMDSALNELSHLMESLLTLSRLRLAQQPPPREDVALDQMLEECTARFDDARIQLNLMPCHLYANRQLLERAFSNLIENACKYAHQHITISLMLVGDDIELNISDDGPGIPEEAREWVRQPFFRVDKHRNRCTGGVGLGLAIVDLALKDSGAQWTIGASAWGGASFHLKWCSACGY
jgi:signal transduction histidine kinase